MIREILSSWKRSNWIDVIKERDRLMESARLATEEQERQAASEIDPKTLLRTVDYAPGDETPPLPSGEMKDYVMLAKRAGLYGVADRIESDTEAEQTRYRKRATQRQLRRFLAESGLAVYDWDSVVKYMNRILPQGMYWGWCVASVPLDYHKLPLYQKPIPQAVVLTMLKIREVFPSAVFEVTDVFKMPKPDPFLSVFLLESTDRYHVRSFNGHDPSSAYMKVDQADRFIIERWDEPSFRQ